MFGCKPCAKLPFASVCVNCKYAYRILWSKRKTCRFAAKHIKKRRKLNNIIHLNKTGSSFLGLVLCFPQPIKRVVACSYLVKPTLLKHNQMCRVLGKNTVLLWINENFIQIFAFIFHQMPFLGLIVLSTCAKICEYWIWAFCPNFKNVCFCVTPTQICAFLLGLQRQSQLCLQNLIFVMKQKTSHKLNIVDAKIIGEIFPL